MAIPDVQVWSVYLLRCADDSLYTGIAVDVERRLLQHQRGERGAKCLRGRGPIELVFEQPVGNRSTASQIEYRIKQLPKSEKERLLRSPETFRSHIRTLVSGRADSRA